MIVQCQKMGTVEPGLSGPLCSREISRHLYKGNSPDNRNAYILTWLAYKRYLYSMIVIRKVLSFGQGKPEESIAHCSTCNHMHKQSLAIPSVHAWECIPGLQLVWILRFQVKHSDEQKVRIIRNLYSMYG